MVLSILLLCVFAISLAGLLAGQVFACPHEPVERSRAEAAGLGDVRKDRPAQRVLYGSVGGNAPAFWRVHVGHGDGWGGPSIIECPSRAPVLTGAHSYRSARTIQVAMRGLARRAPRRLAWIVGVGVGSKAVAAT